MSKILTNEIKEDEILPGTIPETNDVRKQGTKVLSNEVKNDKTLNQAEPNLKGTSKETFIPDPATGVLKASTQIKLISDTDTLVSDISDTNEHTLITENILAKTLTAGSAFRFKAWGSFLRQNNATTQTIRCKYGGSTIATFTPSNVSGTGTEYISIEVTCIATDTINTQKGYGIFNMYKYSGAATYGMEDLGGQITNGVQVTIDSDTNQDFILTTQMNNITSPSYITLEGYTLEIIKI